MSDESLLLVVDDALVEVTVLSIVLLGSSSEDLVEDEDDLR